MALDQRPKFVSLHCLTLAHIACNPQTTYRELASALGVTERHAVRFVRDLQAEGILTYERESRGNRYKINMTAKIPDVNGDRKLSVRQVVNTLKPFVAQ